MKRGFNEDDYSPAAMEAANKRRKPNQDTAIDPALLGTHNSTGERGTGQPNSERDIQRAPEAFGTSQRARASTRSGMEVPSNYPTLPEYPQQSTYQDYARYPDIGLINPVGSRDRDSNHSTMVGFPVVPERQTEVETDPAPIKTSMTKTSKRVARSSKKRSSTDAGLSDDAEDAEDKPEDTTFGSRKSTRQSKRTNKSNKYKDADEKGEAKERKTSKLKIRIAEGKGPKKGSLAPNGVVRTREDGRMEFWDTDIQEWTLAAYHHEYRRQFLDEAAENGEFDHTPSRGHAADDETSFEPEQKNWGSSRADWQNIVNSEGKKVMFDTEKIKNRRPPEEPRIWVHDGLVLLDLKNRPVKDWPGLNKTLSSEIESWRWEALMRKFPWLTVADLMARMPRTREKDGEVMPLQTPTAFTNRALRFRIPNQIPAFKPKKGSDTYREGILKSLSEKNMQTTEELPTLDQNQIKKVREANKGKFRDNSRYVVKDKESLDNPAPSKKRKAPENDDTESEAEQEATTAKKVCTQAPHNAELEVPKLDDTAPASIQDGTSEGTYWGDGGFYEGPTDSAGPSEDTFPSNYLTGAGLYDASAEDPGTVGNQQQEVYPTDTTGLGQYQDQDYLVPLFMSNDDRELALVEDGTWTTPGAVIWARQTGNQQTRQIGVAWYWQSTPRYSAPNGDILEGVVDGAFRDTIAMEEPIPGDALPISQMSNLDDTGYDPSQSGLLTVSEPWLDEQSYDGYGGVPQQTWSDPQTTPLVTAFPSWQTPLPAPNPLGRYQTPSDASHETWRNQFGPSGF